MSTIGYPVPEQKDGHPPICFQMQIPNAPEYRQAILGQITHLFRWYAWERTGTREGAETAEVLKQYALTMQFIEDCQQAGIAMIFRQTDCTLEVSTDDGETWNIIFDADPCKPTIIYENNTLYVDNQIIFTGDQITNTIIDNTETIKPDGIDKKCNMASYLVSIPLPDLATKLLDEHDNANDLDAFILGALAIGALVVTGGFALGAIPALSTGLALGSIGSVSAMLAIDAVLNNIDTAQARLEMDNTFWQQDAKCVIYCNIGNDGKLDDESMVRIATAIDAELTANYPNGAPLLSGIFRTLSTEARNKFMYFGAVYDGQNCDLCACESWTFGLHGKTYTSKYEVYSNNTISNGNVIRDGTYPEHDDFLQVELDLRKTPAYLTKIRVVGKVYKESGDSGGREARIELWDEINQAWIIQWETFFSTGVGEDKFSPTKPGGSDTVLLFPTSRVRVTLSGWGTGSSTWEFTKLQIVVTGNGYNVLEEERQSMS